MEKLYCQSCGMPMGDTKDLYGTEADGSKSNDYCQYCYTQGAFTVNCSMEEMIETCIAPMVAANDHMSEAEASEGMRVWFQTLKRWR